MVHLKRLLAYIFRYKYLFWGGMFGLLVARVFEAMIPLYLKEAIDSITAGQPQLKIPALAIIGCVTARFISIISSRRLIRRIGVAVTYDLRKRVFSHIQKQGPGFFSEHGTGDLMARAVNDIQLVRQLIGGWTRSVVVMFFCAIVGLYFMLRLSPSLTILIVPPLPIISLIAYLFSKRVFARSVAVQEGFADVADFTQENLNGIRTIQAQAQELEEIRRFDKVNTDYADKNLALIRINSKIGSVMPAMGALCQLAVLGFGGSRVLNGEMSVGTFAAFFWYLNMLLMPVRDAGNIVTMYQRGVTGAKRLYEILDAEPEIIDRPTYRTPHTISGRIEFKDLSFAYPLAEKQALQSVTATINTGETIAVFGRIGSGKSTLLSLFVRLFDPPPGTLFIDGHDVMDYPLVHLRNQITLVLQDPFLFSDSLHANISYDNPSRSMEEVWSAAKSADLFDTVLGFSDQMNTVIGERGVNLSGGQKQRLTLARGLIRNSSILMLDDCFSSVDTETEANILSRLRRMRAGLTTLLVSHRVSTVQHADRIIVLDEGRIAEMGTHEELISLKGLYANVEKVQSRKSALKELMGGNNHEKRMGEGI